MKRTQLLIIGLLVTTLLFSCKDDANKTTPKEIVKKELTPVQKERATSVWTKITAAKDAKKFTRLMVSAGIADTLFVTTSEFTVFVPTNTSFSIFKDKMNITNNPEQKEELAALLKNHIVSGSMSSADLVQAIKANTNVELTTLGGEKIMASMKGDTIVITSSAGRNAIVTKSDITASNGVVHMVDGLLQ